MTFAMGPGPSGISHQDLFLGNKTFFLTVSKIHHVCLFYKNVK